MLLGFNFESPENDQFFLLDPHPLVFSLFEALPKKKEIKADTLSYCPNVIEKL